MVLCVVLCTRASTRCVLLAMGSQALAARVSCNSADPTQCAANSLITQEVQQLSTRPQARHRYEVVFALSCRTQVAWLYCHPFIRPPAMSALHLDLPRNKACGWLLRLQLVLLLQVVFCHRRLRIWYEAHYACLSAPAIMPIPASSLAYSSSSAMLGCGPATRADTTVASLVHLTDIARV